MADCVFPTRTARFGVALTHQGPLNLSEKLESDTYILFPAEVHLQS